VTGNREIDVYQFPDPPFPNSFIQRAFPFFGTAKVMENLIQQNFEMKIFR